ncbi:MAG: polyamine aminopropyltransferase [Dehalococcoidales bacterium]|nr:polyamine aminopropyltransferase [Dehalococcoidales bacterium]
MDIESTKWFFDKINPHLLQLHAIESALYTGRTKFQSIEILKSPSFGKLLVLDGKVQSSEVDEFVYHEVLVHPPMLTHPRPEKVFIVGGGEGATLREVLAHPTVKKAVMVDIDEDVIKVCKKYLPEYNAGAFDDKRAEIYHTDARKWLADSKDKFDVIIIDLTEPVEEGPAYLLYTKEFYQIVRNKLTKDGIISVQAGCASFTELLNLKAVNHTLKSIFPIVNVYQADIPSFGGPWGFCIASMTLDTAALTPAEVDRKIKARSLKNLKFYDGLTHQSMFTLPKHMRKAIARGGRLITDDNPLYLYHE